MQRFQKQSLSLKIVWESLQGELRSSVENVKRGSVGQTMTLISLLPNDSVSKLANSKIRLQGNLWADFLGLSLVHLFLCKRFPPNKTSHILAFFSPQQMVATRKNLLIAKLLKKDCGLLVCTRVLR